MAAERDAAARSLDATATDEPPVDLRAHTGAGVVDLLAAGAGVAAAAAATATVLGRERYDLVISAGVAGAFAPAGIGDTVVAAAVVSADLGAEDGDRFLPLSELGLGQERADLDPLLTAELARRTGAHVGAVLCVSTGTGSAPTADRRRTRHPDARAEAMEGAGVLAAARLHGVPMAEVRTISNLVGPRDRSAWRLDLALDALAAAVRAIVAAPLSSIVAAPRSSIVAAPRSSIVAPPRSSIVAPPRSSIVAPPR